MQSVDSAKVVKSDEFDSINGKEFPVDVRLDVISPFFVHDKSADMNDDDVKIVGPVYVGSDEMLDRHDELVTTDAIMDAWDGYSRNPVILYNHSKTYGVIGRMTGVKLGEFQGAKVPIGTAIIDAGEKDITRKIRKGMLKAFSIGFIAKAAVKECKDDDSCYMKFTEIDWVETSVVDVPASPNALFSVQKTILGGIQTSSKDCGCGCGGAKSKVKIEEDEDGISITYDGEKREVRTDVFTTVEEAEARAEEIGCEGIHSHDMDGTTVYMPCNSHDDYTEATGEELASYHDEEEEEMGYYDEEDESKAILDRISRLEQEILDLVDGKSTVNSHGSEQVGLMTAEEAITNSEEEHPEGLEVEEESAHEEAPIMPVEEKTVDEEETSEEAPVEEKSVEADEDVPMPSPREALMDVASALKHIIEMLEAKDAPAVVEEESSEDDELTQIKAELEALKAEKAEREAKEAFDSAVDARVAEVLAEKGEAVPARKSIVPVAEKAKDVTRFDPQPTVSKGMNGLADWLAQNLEQRG